MKLQPILALLLAGSSSIVVSSAHVAIALPQQQCTQISSSQANQIKVGMTLAQVQNSLGKTSCSARGQHSYWIPSEHRYLGVVIRDGKVTKIRRDAPVG